MVSHYQAVVAEAQVAVLGVYEDMALEVPHSVNEVFDGAATEIRAALCLTRRAADNELGFAIDLFRRLPRVFQALCDGVIDKPRAKVIVEGVAHLDDDQAHQIVDQVLDEDAAELTTGQLRARLRKLTLESDPDDARARFDQALDNRRVFVGSNPAGTANLVGLDLAPSRVMTVSKRIYRIAKRLKNQGDPRSLDQLEADIYLTCWWANTKTTGRRDRSLFMSSWTPWLGWGTPPGTWRGSDRW